MSSGYCTIRELYMPVLAEATGTEARLGGRVISILRKNCPQPLLVLSK